MSEDDQGGTIFPGDPEASELVSQFMQSVRSGDPVTLRKIFSDPSAPSLLNQAMNDSSTQEVTETLEVLLGVLGGMGSDGRTQDAAALLDALSAEHKVAILTTERCAAEYLAGRGLAANIVRVLDGLEVQQQVEVLSAWTAVGGLLHNGQAPAVFRLLDGMNADQKTQVLSTYSVVEDFARHKLGGKLMKLMRELNWAQQGEILSQPDAIWALRKYGQRRQVNDMLVSIKVAQEPWLSKPAITH